MNVSDMLIIGAGPAGLTAAIYGLRAGLTAVVFDRGVYGGQVAQTAQVENYPAVLRISGPDFAQAIYEQAAQLGADIRMESVERVELDGSPKRVFTPEGAYEGRTVVIANGAKRRLLGCEGEDAFTGRGVSYCATCDGAFFRGRDVAVVGGGNTALEDALYLANLCRRVTMIHRRDSFRGQKLLADAVGQRENIDVLFRHEVVRIEGEQAVGSVVVRGADGRQSRLQAAGVFIAIGYEPDNALFAAQLPLDAHGYIRAGEDCRTSIPGVYAAGDNRTKPLRQIVTAAADGAVAASQAAARILAGM